MITIGYRLPVPQYVRIIKNVLNSARHEELELHGYGTSGMAKLTQVVNVLSTWGYISVVKIKTRSEPALKITIKKAADFQKNFDEFAAVLQKRRDEREQLRLEKKEAAEAAAADAATAEAAAAADKAESTPADAEGEAKAEPAAEAHAESEADPKADPKADAEAEPKADAEESKA